MELLDVAIVAGLVVAYAAVSGRLEHAPVTAPMLFVAAGAVLGPGALGVLELDVGSTVVRTLAELTLVLILFSDAARIDLRALGSQYRLPARLLGVGMPLTIAAGTAVGLVAFPGLAVWEAALLAAVLAPTDAALAQSVVSNADVPVRIRQAVNVESGLNDGIVLPVITLFVAAAGGRLAAGAGGAWIVAEQLGYGAGVGLAGGLLGGWVVDRASARAWMGGRFQQIAALAVGLGAFALSAWLGGSGFVAAFTAGLGFGLVARERCEGIYAFTEEEAHLLAMLTFLVFGGALVGPALARTTPATVAYAVASLTVVRLVPVGVALVGSGLHADSVLYLGWFGPRGLASIVFGLVIVEESGLSVAEPLLHVVVWTVLVSVFAHGASGAPAARSYARRDERRRRREGDRAEHAPATPMPVRR